MRRHTLSALVTMLFLAPMLNTQKPVGQQPVQAKQIKLIQQKHTNLGKQITLAKMQLKEGKLADKQPVRTKLIDLIQQKHARAGLHIKRVKRLLKQGKLDEAGAALKAARQSNAEARTGFSLIEKSAERLKYYASLIEDLSIIKVRIVNARQTFPDVADPQLRKLQRIVDLFVRWRLLNQTIKAQILEAHTVGVRYASKTVYGKRFPARMRSDLVSGQTVDLVSDAPENGVAQLKEGREYWFAITPPIASKGIPKHFGAIGKTKILFAMRARKRRKV